MTGESTGRKIWRVVYPILTLFVLYFGVIYGSMMIISSSCAGSGTLDSNMEKYFSIVVAVALAIIIIVEYFFFKGDAPVQSRLIFQKPKYIGFLILFGAAFGHGLNLLISLFNINGIFDSYEAVQSEIFAPGIILVIVRAVLLAPIAEELVFRGLVFRRMREYTGFWPAALVSAALFGLYHMNLPQGIYAFLFGIMLAVLYDRFRNILVPILVHFAANLLSVILEYTKAEYPNTAIYIVAMAASFAVAVLLYLFIFRKADKQ